MSQDQRALYHIRISLNKDEWFLKYEVLSSVESHHMLLESGRGGRYTIIGLSPFAVLEGKDDRLSITSSNETTEQTGNILDLMQEWMGKYETSYVEGLPDFQGGAIGYFSYDCIRYIEKIPESSKDDLHMPDLYFLVFNDVFVYDHVDDELWIIVHDSSEEAANTRLDEYKEMWQHSENQGIQYKYHDQHTDENPSVSQEEASFKVAVERVQEYIKSGDVFQVNLSVRQSKPLQTEPLHIYSKLRVLNPSPYMGFLQAPEFQLISASPELLVKKKGRRISTRPIAGTRSRGQNDEEDEKLANELISNEKERAEHVMLVDLERNDIGRVCEFGTVEVDEFMVIEKYSHVMHIVSNVKGLLREDKHAFDVAKAVFPGGTITGAPKVRTMEIIEELEPVRRGIYTGSIGWIGFNGDMELNIIIRTMLAKDGLAYVQAGAGIVIDSKPKAEYKECLKKAKALWQAKELSENELKNDQKVEQR